MRTLCLVSPFISPMAEARFDLKAVSKKVESEKIPTYIVTRAPVEPYQHEALAILERNDWIEIRFNESLHAKVFIASATREAESFALFGSGNLTARSISTNLEVGMMLVAQGAGRPLVTELFYWANNTLRILPETRLHKPIRATKRKS